MGNCRLQNWVPSSMGTFQFWTNCSWPLAQSVVPLWRNFQTPWIEIKLFYQKRSYFKDYIKILPFCCKDWMNYIKIPLVNTAPFLAYSLRQKYLNFDEIFITDCTGSYQNDNFQCSWWWKFHPNDDIFISVSNDDGESGILMNKTNQWHQICRGAGLIMPALLAITLH